MNDEERELLESTYKLVHDTNDKVTRLYRSYRLGRAVKVVYWAAIIALSVGAYWLIQPYVNQLKEVYGGLGDTVNNLHDTSRNLLNL